MQHKNRNAASVCRPGGDGAVTEHDEYGATPHAMQGLTLDGHPSIALPSADPQRSSHNCHSIASQVWS